MSIFMSRSAARWLVPVTIAALAVGGAGLVTKVTASADPVLPARTAAQLLVDLQKARLDAVSGTVVHKADLGLPALPMVSSGGSSDFSSMASGSHTLRIWYAGPSKVRLALLGTLGESDVVRNGRDLWLWSSQDNTATHRRLPTDGSGQRTPTLEELAGPRGLTPQQAADRALAALDPTTAVSTEGTARVAGRSAYELVLRPRDAASLVGQVRVAIDAARRIPLRLQVFPRARPAQPAFEVAFTQVSFARPADSQFRFTPPPGVKVTEAAADEPLLPLDHEHPATAPRTSGPATAPGASKPGTAPPASKPGTDPRATGPGMAQRSAGAAAPAVSGQGWTAVLQARLPDGLQGADPRSQGGPAGQLAGVLSSLPRVSGSWGSGRLLSSRLLSVLVLQDGRVLAGAVRPERLYQLAAQPMPAAQGSAGAGR